MELHLFSTPASGSTPTAAVDACREVLHGKRDASMACLPQGMLTADRWLREAQRQFHDVAQIEVIDTETMEPNEMEAVLRRAALVYIPDGNAYLLNHRLQTSRIAAHLRKKIQNGLRVVACGAGAVVCGSNILTAGDLNVVPTTHFDGLGVTPFNIHARYRDDADGDDWFSEYHVFHDNPVLMLEDGACIRVSGKTTSLRAGAGWIRRAGQDKAALKLGEPILLNGAAT
jgi:peptidase E